MSHRPPRAGTTLPPGVSLLIVATVSVTIRNFFIPYARHFRSLGWRVDAAANGAGDNAAIREAFDDVYDLPLSRSILDVTALVRGTRAVSKVLGSGYDLVHVHTPIAGFVARFAVGRAPADRRPAIVYTTHGFHFHEGGHFVTNTAFLAAEKLAGRWTDRLVVLNDHDERAARRNQIVPPGRLVRMPGIGVDTGRYSREAVGAAALDQARLGLRVPPGGPLFVVVGELNRNKRPEDAIEALALMRRTDACLVLAGEGSEQHRLEAIASRRGVADRVRFPGFIDDLRPVVAAATALVMTSKREGLSRSIMEALALGVPVVASTARGNRELVDAGSGFIVPTGDIGGLAAAMDWLAAHPAEREAMGRHGRQRMSERFDLATLLRLHEDMYAGMLGARSGAGDSPRRAPGGRLKHTNGPAIPPGGSAR